MIKKVVESIQTLQVKGDGEGKAEGQQQQQEQQAALAANGAPQAPEAPGAKPTAAPAAAGGAAEEEEDPLKKAKKDARKAEKAEKAAKLAKKLEARAEAERLKKEKEKGAGAGAGADGAKKARPRKEGREEEDPVALRQRAQQTPKGARKDFEGLYPSKYDPQFVEAALYDWWQEQGYFKPRAPQGAPGDPSKKGEDDRFVIVIPPPNVTGTLHLGHALTVAIEDTLVRWHRMCGRETLWVPGKDHAGIATQIVVEKQLHAEKQLTRHDIGREAFVERVKGWVEEYGGRIDGQLARLGASPDWDRKTFTLDPGPVRAVAEAFARLHAEGLVYRDNRMTNWDPHLRTAVSDIEVEHETVAPFTRRKVPGHAGDVEFGTLTSFAYRVAPLEAAAASSESQPAPASGTGPASGTAPGAASGTAPGTARAPPAAAADPGAPMTPAAGPAGRGAEGGADGGTGGGGEREAGRGGEGEVEEIVVATTRPETMLADAAVAVHPDDPRWGIPPPKNCSVEYRYTHLHGRCVVHPLDGRRLPVVLDAELVRMDFGTGAVKITPAHDPNDFACGKRHGLPLVTMLDDGGIVNAHGGRFQGQSRYQARESVVAWLKDLGLFRGVEGHEMALGICTRSNNVIEPMLKPQWYVECSGMAAEACAAVEDGRLTILPAEYRAVWFRWLRAGQPWCVSRQLWWGHRIPAYYVSLEGEGGASAPGGPSERTDRWVVATSEAAAEKLARERFPGRALSLKQDEDVLDTWFSSGLFPFSVFGWPDATPDLARFYPTTLLETGHDIIFFWVARMVMLGMRLTGQVPFRQVFLHSMVRDAHGRKMSKSLGNVIDPLHVISGISLQELHRTLESGNLAPSEVAKAREGQRRDFPQGIEECGTDALRFSLVAYTSQASDINLDVNRIVAARHWCNKLWQAVRFANLNLGPGFVPDPPPPPGPGAAAGTQEVAGGSPGGPPEGPPLPLACRWILSRLNAAVAAVGEGFQAFAFGRVAEALYDFWLKALCDVFIELVKPAVAAGAAPATTRAFRQTLWTCLDTGLRLLHPVMPYVTEELWQRLPRPPPGGSVPRPPSIMVAPYPQPRGDWDAPDAEATMRAVEEVVAAVRSLRAEYQLASNQRPAVYLLAARPERGGPLGAALGEIATLSASASVAVVASADEAPPGCSVAVMDEDLSVLLDLQGVVDPAKEAAKLRAKQAQLRDRIDKAKRKQAMPSYADGTPAHIREAEAEKLGQALKELATCEDHLMKLEARKQ